MTNKIKFSIIIPLYNKAKYIRKTLLSILNQTFTDYEIIIVDDGSTDNSLAIANSIKDKRIKVFSKINEGVSAARNYGIEKASYQYIAFIDADDWWHPLFLTKIKELIENYPEAKMFATSFAEVSNQDEKPNINYKLLPKGKQTLDYIKVFSKTFISPIWTSAVVIEYSILKKLKFNNKISTGEDLLLWIQIANKHQVAYNNEILSFYNRDVSNSLSRKLIPIKKNFMLYIKAEIEEPTQQINDLIDTLTVRMLRPYYIFNLYPKETHTILKSIDFSRQKLIYRLFYKLPKPIIKLLYIVTKKIYENFINK
ncbi:MAG: glycosyltransferase family 2 protein [Phocaeicola sp.]|nr:glycosyltransferase family 2 protein [Phocaeicola sp.]